MSEHRRARKVVFTRIQVEGIVHVCLAVAITAVLQALIMAYSIRTVVADPGVTVDQMQDQVASFNVHNAVITAIAMVPAIIILGRSATHRLVGPVYKFRRFLEGVRDGQSAPCTLRDGDHFEDVCQLLNEVTAGIRKDQDPASESSSKATAESSVSMDQCSESPV